jgi:hypothetical protein
MGVPSGSSTSSTKQMTCQWRRINCPITASPSTRHSSSFSSNVSIFVSWYDNQLANKYLDC